MTNVIKRSGGTVLARRIGTNIRNARQRINRSQVQLASEIGISTVSLSRIEAGVQLPAMERLEDIARLLGVPFMEVLLEPGGDDGYVVPMTELMRTLTVEEQRCTYRLVELYVHLRKPA